MDRGREKYREKNPKESANLFSLLTFWYTIKLFIKGYAKSLQVDDLYEVTESCRAEKLADQLQKEWDHQKKPPSLLQSLWNCFGHYYLFLGCIQLVFDLISTIWSPYAFSKLIASFSPNQTEISAGDAIFYAAIGIGNGVLYMFYYHNMRILLIQLGIQIRTAIVSLLYRKALKLSDKALSQVTVGKIITITTKDVDCFELFIEYGNDIWIGAVKTVVAAWLIYAKIGISSIAGIALLALIFPLGMYIGRMSYFLRLKSCAKTDQRLELVQEVLSAIKIIKMYTWERFFASKIKETRRRELLNLHKLFYTKIVIIVIGELATKAAFLVFILCLVWLGNSITAETAYYIMSLCNHLSGNLTVSIPLGISYGAEVYSAAKRAESVLHAEEVPTMVAGCSTEKPEVVTKSFVITPKRKLNVVVGQVGAGKSTFLKKLIINSSVEEFYVSGTVSYAAQEPWLFPSSIKNNIVFGEEYNEARYQQVLDVCALKYDLEIFPEGDSTIISDRGTNLSKGQQCRINLARAIYKNSDIYLLDDCLAALDAHVSDSIFRKCIQGFLGTKICLFVSNNMDYVYKADGLVIIERNCIGYKDNVHELNVELVKSLQQKCKLERNGVIKSDDRKEVFHEVKKGGSVDWKIYWSYIQLGGGPLVFALVLSTFILSQGTYSINDKITSNWVTLEQNLSTTNMTLPYSEITKSLITEKDRVFAMLVLTSLGGAFVALGRFLAFMQYAKKASIKMHKLMLNSIINSKMEFFDTHFIGNILNRFSKDMMDMDEHFPFILLYFLKMVFTAAGGLILISSVNWIFILQCLLLTLICCSLKFFYQPTGRNIQRLHSLTKSPLIGHLNSTLDGLPTIHAARAESIVTAEFQRHQNLHTSASLISECNMEALSLSLDFFAIVFTSVVIIQFLTIDFGNSVGDVGMVITQCFTVSDIIMMGVRNLAVCENRLTSLERIMEYVALETEKSGNEAAGDWSGMGEVQFRAVGLQLGAKNQPVLKSINFSLGPGEKLGIVGRTGAGKSSIISVLLRMYDFEGEVRIGGKDSRQVPLEVLRAGIAVIPQDPFLFSGTIRENIDPFNTMSDEEIWSVFGDLGLSKVVGDLDVRLDKGANLSAGQQQLFCLARAVLRRCKIVVLDEPTANVDRQTDALIQETIQTQFSNCTQIVIAHRLHSVLECQRVIVLDRGEISEIGPPHQLLQNRNSFLHCVVK